MVAEIWVGCLPDIRAVDFVEEIKYFTTLILNADETAEL